MPKRKEADKENILATSSKEVISAQLHQEETYRLLLTKGYSTIQVKSLIRVKSSQNAINNLISQHDNLIKIFTHSQLIHILIGHPDGAGNLEAILKYADQLLSLGFTGDKIVNIASQTDCANSLEAVLKYTAQLLSLGFSHTQITKIANCKYGANNLEAVVKYTRQLNSLGLSEEEITNIGCQINGPDNLEAVAKYAIVLQAFGFSQSQIILIASFKGGADNIKAVFISSMKLFDLSFTPQQIISLANFKAGAKNIETVCTHAKTLVKDLGFTITQIVRIATTYRCGAENVEAVFNHASVLLELGFSHEQIINIASHDTGSHNIETLRKRTNALLDMGFSRQKIFILASERLGSHNLENAYKNFQSLNAQNTVSLTTESFKPIQADPLATRKNKDPHNLEAEFTSVQGLLELGFSTDKPEIKTSTFQPLGVMPPSVYILLTLGFLKNELIEIAKSLGDLSNWDEIAIAIRSLARLGFSKDETIKIARCSGGLDNLKIGLLSAEAIKNLGFSTFEIVTTVKSTADFDSLNIALKYAQALLNLGFSKKEILQMATHHGGLHTLEMVYKDFEGWQSAMLSNSLPLGIIPPPNFNYNPVMPEQKQQTPAPPIDLSSTITAKKYPMKPSSSLLINKGVKSISSNSENSLSTDSSALSLLATLSGSFWQSAQKTKITKKTTGDIVNPELNS